MSMQIFAAVGPLGAGKTTLTINTVNALKQRRLLGEDDWAFVVNEEKTYADKALTARLANVMAMTNGCFTCSDSAELVGLLARLSGMGKRWVFLEGFGMTSGNETKTLLKSCPYPFHIVCVLDLKNHDKNLVRYAKVVQSQVHASTLGTGITKYGSAASVMDLPADVLDFAAKHSHGKRAFLVSPDGSLPPEVFQELLQEKPARVAVALAHDCGHDHGHGHTHDHGVYLASYSLRQGVVLADIVAALRDPVIDILRAKGVAGGQAFDNVFDDWTQPAGNPIFSPPFVSFYTRQQISLGVHLPELAKLVAVDREAADLREGYELMREETVSAEKTIEEIERLIAAPFPSPILLAQHGLIRLITHPEDPIQLLKEISRRPQVKEEWFPRALARCMEYWVMCGRILKSCEALILPSDLATNKRELANSLAWWTQAYGSHFGEGILLATKELKIGEMAAQGVLGLASLNADLEKAYWQCQEIVCAAKFGLANGEDATLIKQAIAHSLALSLGTPAESEWRKASEQIA